MHCHPKSPDSSRPFLKYAGGKSRLLSQLLPLLPVRSRLIEPFVGAGSVFLAANYSSYLLNDANPDLVAMWVALKERPREFTYAAAAYFDGEYDTAAAYYQVRAEFNAEVDRFERAIRLPYLNRFGFNGLWRVNGKGKFNVPFGRPTTKPLFPWDEMAAAARKLENCTVTCANFSAPMQQAGRGDVVYADPPYLAQPGSSAFTAYTSSGFSLEDHRQLVELAVQAARRRATVVLSNNDTPETRSLYRNFELHGVDVRRSVSANAAARGNAKELIAVLRG